MGSGNFISGFLQGFGKEFSDHRERQHQQEQQDHQARFNVLSKVLSDPSTTPEMASVIHKDFFSKNLKSKEEKQAFEKIFQMYSQAKVPSTEAQQAQGNIENQQQVNQAVGANPEQQQASLQDMTRPRMSMTASPRYSPEQQNQLEADRTFKMTKAHEDATAPRLRQQEADKYRMTMEKQAFSDQAKLEREHAKTLAKASGDVDKYATAIMEEQRNLLGRDLTPDEIQSARGQAGQQIREEREAKVDYIKKRGEAVDSSIARGKAYIAHLTKLESQKDEQLRISAKNASTSSRNADINAARAGLQQQRDAYAQQRDKINQNLKRIGQLQTEFNGWKNALGNPFPTPEKEQAPARMQAIEAEQNRLDEENKEIGKQVGAPTEISQPSMTTTPTPTSSPTSPKKMTKTPSSNGRPYKIIRSKQDGKQYKFYGYKPDGQPDLEAVP